MTQMPVEANVVLTADNSQYDQTMMASAGQTQQLANTVDSLTKKLASISRSAGRGLIDIAAADVGVITAATAAWGAYESQTSRLSAQAAIISRNSMEQTRTMGAYTKSVNQLREGYGTTTREGARLVETISRLTQNRATRDMTGLTKVFTDMSKATGEDSSGLAGSLLNLQKVMGTQVDRRTTRRYADQLTYLSQQTGTSAASLADFSAQIGPVGQLLNMTQTEVTGVATAFSQAGQDGYGAASAFNKVVTDIAYATESGSPALANYANLMGMTVDQFKDMEGTEQVLRFFERVGELGPAAIEDLQRLGYDGQRLVRYVTGVANQSGGLRTAIAEATGAMDSNASAKGAQAAMRGVGDELAKIREEGLRIGEIFAEWSGPVMVKVLQGVESLASALRKMMEGPLGDVVKAASMIAAPFAAAAGAVLSMAAPLATLATAALFFRGAGFRGFREGLQGAPRVAESGLQPVGLGRTGQQIAERGSAFQRNIYNASNMLGRVVGPPAAALASSRIFGGTNPNNLPLWQRGVALGLNGAAWGVRNVGTSIYSPLTMAGYRDPTQRVRLLNDSRPFRQQFMDAFRETTTGRTQGSGRQGVVGNTSLFDPNMRINDEGKVSTVATDARAAREEERRRADAERQRTSTIARSTATMGSAFGNVVRASGAVAGAMTSAATQATLLAGKLGAAGLGKFAGSGAAIGTGALMAGSAMGIDSNALTFGATGLMFGAKYGAIGAVAGAGFDVYQQNKNRNEVQANYEKTLANGSPSEVFAAGQPISDEFNRINNLFEERNTTWTRGIPVLGAAIGGYSPQQIMQQSLLGAEGLFTGSNPVKKSFDAEERRQMEEQNTVGAYQALSSRLGNEVTGFDFKSEADWAKLDEVLLKITPAMEELGITSEDIVKTWQEGDSAEWVALMNQIANPGKYTGLAERIGILNESGERFNENPLVATAIEQPENINAQYQAISNELADSLRQGMSYREVIRQRGDIMATVGTTDAPEYQLNAAIMGQARQALAYQQPFMTRTGGYRQQAGLLTDQVQMAAGDPAQQDQVNAQVGQFMQATVGQVQYFQQLLLQQREFNISRERSEEDFARQQERSFYQYTLGRERAEEDFNLSRKYAQFDFHLARERQEYQYELSRERAKDNFYRSMNRSERNFQISRNRAERDHAHQVELMAE